VELAGIRQIRQGDILIAMDGEGSIGKAAVFSGDYVAVPDSHLGILRLGPELAWALACYLNSSLGQAQIELAISGSGETNVGGQLAEYARVVEARNVLKAKIG
jgi:hypothetical protein